MQMCTEKKREGNILNGEESQGQDKKAEEFPQNFFLFCVCNKKIREKEKAWLKSL